MSIKLYVSGTEFALADKDNVEFNENKLNRIYVNDSLVYERTINFQEEIRQPGRIYSEHTKSSLQKLLSLTSTATKRLTFTFFHDVTKDGITYPATLHFEKPDGNVNYRIGAYFLTYKYESDTSWDLVRLSDLANKATGSNTYSTGILIFSNFSWTTGGTITGAYNTFSSVNGFGVSVKCSSGTRNTYFNNEGIRHTDQSPVHCVARYNGPAEWYGFRE